MTLKTQLNLNEIKVAYSASEPEQIWTVLTNQQISKISLHVIYFLYLVLNAFFQGSECLKIDGGWSFAPDPTGEAYSTPLTSSCI